MVGPAAFESAKAAQRANHKKAHLSIFLSGNGQLVCNYFFTSARESEFGRWPKSAKGPFPPAQVRVFFFFTFFLVGNLSILCPPNLSPSFGTTSLFKSGFGSGCGEVTFVVLKIFRLKLINGGSLQRLKPAQSFSRLCGARTNQFLSSTSIFFSTKLKNYFITKLSSENLAFDAYNNILLVKETWDKIYRIASFFIKAWKLISISKIIQL